MRFRAGPDSESGRHGLMLGAGRWFGFPLVSLGVRVVLVVVIGVPRSLVWYGTTIMCRLSTVVSMFTVD